MPDWQTLRSSNVAACAYDPQSRTLQIRYHSGRTYSYADVPQSVYEDLLAAPSPGTFVNDSIKGLYSYA